MTARGMLACIASTLETFANKKPFRESSEVPADDDQWHRQIRHRQLKKTSGGHHRSSGFALLLVDQ